MNPSLAISEVMTRQVVTIHETGSVQEAKEHFEAYSFHHLPVVDDIGKICGIVSMLDLPNATQNGITEISQIMTPDPTTLEENDSIGLAADIFLANSFHAIPIMDDNELVGILTTHDLIKFAYKDVI